MKIYIASSWRNIRQPTIVMALRENGHEVYDFKNPHPGENGFHWSEIDPNWREWSIIKYRDALNHPIAQQSYYSNFNAMQWADAVVLVLPCGMSAHLELGWACGQSKHTFVLLDKEASEPELMMLMADYICVTLKELIGKLRTLEPTKEGKRRYITDGMYDDLPCICTEKCPKTCSGKSDDQVDCDCEACSHAYLDGLEG